MILGPPAAAVAAEIAAATAREVDRLVGQRVTVAADGRSYRILDVAGEGRPVVGVVERRGRELWLVPADADAGLPPVRLIGPLAVPRLAGPGYKLWVLGKIDAAGACEVRRLGVLAAPPMAGPTPATR